MSSELITKKAVNRVLSDYWLQYKHYPWQSAIGIFLPAIGNVFVFYLPPLVLAGIIDLFVKNHTISLAVAWGSIITFALVWGFGEVLWRIGYDFLNAVEAHGMNDLSKNAFNEIIVQDYDFFTDNFVGSLSKKAFSYSRNFENFTNSIAFDVFANLFPLIFVTYILSRYSPWIPIILIISLVFTITLAIPFIKKRVALTSLRHEANSKLVGRLSDSITNAIAIRSFAREGLEKNIYNKYSDDFTKKHLKAANYNNRNLYLLLSPIYVTTNTIGLIAAIFFAQTLSLQPGAIIIVFSYYASITRIFWEISGTYRTLESSISEAAEFTQLFVDGTVINDLPNAPKLKVREGQISLNDIDFKYDFKEEDSDGEAFLNHLNMTIDSKQRVGLVGPSGGGKTTLTKLLLRFIDPNNGSIMIDGQNIAKVNQCSLRDQISFVPQEPLLFHRSLRENIAYGNPNATEKEIREAARLAHADEFITKLPQGYETLVGERGIKLSGGQRQRIAIARAMLKKSPILVLDEATSALDSESEKLIQDGLWELMKGKTAIVIAHRLSTIRHLDRIVVLNEGKIIQDGTHDELIKQKGLYAKLWNHQTGNQLKD